MKKIRKISPISIWLIGRILVLVAPATANIIGKLANGIADNMITTTIAGSYCSGLDCTRDECSYVRTSGSEKKFRNIYGRYGYRLIEPGEGYLACGYVGKGRIEEPEKIVENINEYFIRQIGKLGR